LLLVFSGAGSICGALIVAAMEKFKGQQRLTVLILTFLGFVIAAFSLSKWLPLSCLLIFLTGVAIMASASLMLSLVQLITTDAMRGRVMSVYNLAFRAGIPLGSLTLGKLIPIFGVAKTLSGAGLMLVAVSIYFLIARSDVNTASPTTV
jgi:predicted MFS family arabinose efflux permease